MEKKICSKCKVEKSTEEFYFRDDKLVAQCKKCTLAYNKQYRDNHAPKKRVNKVKNDINYRGLTQKDILEVPIMLEKMGYDTNKDIHSQFINKVNTKYGLNLQKKSKPKDNFSKYFPQK